MPTRRPGPHHSWHPAPPLPPTRPCIYFPAPLPPAGTADFLRGLEMSEDELSKAIIGTIGDIDAYQLPGEHLEEGVGATRRHGTIPRSCLPAVTGVPGKKAVQQEREGLHTAPLQPASHPP